MKRNALTILILLACMLIISCDIFTCTETVTDEAVMAGLKDDPDIAIDSDLIGETQAKAPQTITVPQNIYGVAAGARAFDLNAEAEGDLIYKSSNEKIAKVSPNGTVTVGRIQGIAKVTITAAPTDQYGSSARNVYVRVTKYKKTNGKIAEAGHDYDGKAGDSLGKESFVRDYYYTPEAKNGGWGFIVRCTDPYISNHAAKAASYIVNNSSFGYNAYSHDSQENIDKRASIYETVQEVVGNNPSYKDLKKIRKIKTKADASCTPTSLSGYWLYIDMSSKISLEWKPPYDETAYDYYCGAVNVEYHQLEKAIEKVNQQYASQGKLEPFEIIYIPEEDRQSYFKKSNIKKHLKRGDIICACQDYESSGHTVIMQ